MNLERKYENTVIAFSSSPIWKLQRSCNRLFVSTLSKIRIHQRVTTKNERPYTVYSDLTILPTFRFIAHKETTPTTSDQNHESLLRNERSAGCASAPVLRAPSSLSQGVAFIRSMSLPLGDSIRFPVLGGNGRVTVARSISQRQRAPIRALRGWTRSKDTWSRIVDAGHDRLAPVARAVGGKRGRTRERERERGAKEHSRNRTNRPTGGQMSWCVRASAPTLSSCVRVNGCFRLVRAPTLLCA